MTQTPGEFYEETQNPITKSDFQRIILKFENVHKISQQDFFQKLSGNISIHMFTARPHTSLGSGALSNRKKYMQLVYNLEIWDKSEWPKKTYPRFGNEQIRELTEKFNVCFSN
jgi:hypothetical protein